MATLVLTVLFTILISASFSECATSGNRCNEHCAITSDWSNWDCSDCHNNVGTASRYRSFCCFLKTKQECLTNCSMESSNIFQRDLCTNVCNIYTTIPSKLHTHPFTTTKPSAVHATQLTTAKPSTVHTPPRSTTVMPRISSPRHQTPVSTSSSVPSNKYILSVITSSVGSGLSTASTRTLALVSTKSTIKLSTVHASPLSITVKPQISSAGYKTLVSGTTSVTSNTHTSSVLTNSVLSGPTKALPAASTTKPSTSRLPSTWTTVMPLLSSTGQQTSVPVPTLQTSPSIRARIQTGIHATQMTSVSLPSHLATTNTQRLAMVSGYSATNAPVSALSAASSPMATTNSDVTLEDTAIPNQGPSTNWSHNSIDSHTAGDYMEHVTEDTEATDRCGGILVSICLFLLGMVIGAVTVAIINHCCCHSNTTCNKNKTNSTKRPHNQTYDVRSQPMRNKELFQSVNAISGFEYGSSRAKNIQQVSPVSSTGSLINPWSDMVENSPSGSPKYPSPVLGPNNPPSLGRHRGSYIIEKIPNSSSSSSSSSNNGDSHARVTID